MRYNRALAIPIKCNYEVTRSIHENVSGGYYNISTSGEKIFVPYKKNELGEIHRFISPGISRYKHMKWTKTRGWSDKEKAKKSRWKYHPTFGGLNTAPRA
jgi:hypothetical protein